VSIDNIPLSILTAGAFVLPGKHTAKAEISISRSECVEDDTYWRDCDNRWRCTVAFTALAGESYRVTGLRKTLWVVDNVESRLISAGECLEY
jgi:hypothetical protein